MYVQWPDFLWQRSSAICYRFICIEEWTLFPFPWLPCNQTRSGLVSNASFPCGILLLTGSNKSNLGFHQALKALSDISQFPIMVWKNPPINSSLFSFKNCARTPSPRTIIEEFSKACLTFWHISSLRGIVDVKGEMEDICGMLAAELWCSWYKSPSSLNTEVGGSNLAAISSLFCQLRVADLPGLKYIHLLNMTKLRALLQKMWHALKW